MDTDSDSNLLLDLRSGQSRAFGILYNRYRLPLFRFCLHMLHDGSRAEDAVHDTFVALLHRAWTIREGASLKAWLFQVARNTVLMSLRRSTPERLSPHDDVWDDDSPLALVEREERIEHVQRMLGLLRVEYREVLILREYDALSYAEIAAVTGATESAVKARLFKARRALARKLAPVLEEVES